MGQKHQRENYAAHEVAEHQLQEAEVAGKGQRRRADDRQGGGFGGHNGESKRPPRRGAAAEEIVTDVLLPPAEVDAEQGDANQVDRQDGEIQWTESHRPALGKVA